MFISLFHGHLVHYIISIIYIINITNFIFTWTICGKIHLFSQHFVSMKIISYIEVYKQCGQKITFFSKNTLFLILIQFVLN